MTTRLGWDIPRIILKNFVIVIIDISTAENKYILWSVGREGGMQIDISKADKQINNGLIK
jgi:hypothetical protein